MKGFPWGRFWLVAATLVGLAGVVGFTLKLLEVF